MDTTRAVHAVQEYKPLIEKISKRAAEQAAMAPDDPHLAGLAIRAEELNRATALLHDEHLDELRAISSQEDAEALYIKMRDALGETKAVKAVMRGAVATNLDGVVDTLWKQRYAFPMTNFAQTTETDENLACYRREVVETFERAIATLDDMVENTGKTGDDLNRLRNKARVLETVWNRQSDRIENAKTLRDLAAIIGFINLEATDPKTAAEGEQEGTELAISYLRQFAQYLPEG